MQKKLNLVFLIVFIIIFSLLLCSCDELKGASAYELAVQNGYEGTLEQWLESLTTTLSPYDVAVNNGYIGTEKEWLDSLKGLNGIDGLDGVNGLNGIDGINGLNGIDGIDGTNGIDGVNIITSCDDIDNITYAFSKAILSTVKIVTEHTDYYYNTILGRLDKSRTVQNSYTGAGVIYSLDKNVGDAYIITNFHVVYSWMSVTDDKLATDLKVYLYGMDYIEYGIDAQYIGGSMTHDIAVIKISASDILKTSSARVVNLSEDKTLPGLKTIAIGNPMSDGLAVTSGIVNIESENIYTTAADNVTNVNFRSIRIDTPVNGGNSGGGLYNLKGELIGVVNSKSTGDEIDNVAYAIPLEIAIGVAQNLIDTCTDQTITKMKKCFLGIQLKVLTSEAVFDNQTGLTTITQQIAIASDIAEDSIVYGVLAKDDIILEAQLNDRELTVIDRDYILGDILFNARIGDTIRFIITRGQSTIEQTIVVTESCLNEII